jgi:hypothetical protein
MAKKDKADGTPIEFYVPGPGKGPKVPIPINQPNWIYKQGFNSRPTIFELFFIVFLIAIVIGLTVLLVTESMYKSPLWIVVITVGIFVILQIRSLIIRAYNYEQNTEENENVAPSNKRKKKYPRHRKDYK